ncbi:MAG TPA: type 4a pilus biogenesis protein PilO [Gemmatimonadota bacterium]|nr:type 4a pilus biogenesis protein PilO [Gemmatimonadota bacterium]
MFGLDSPERQRAALLALVIVGGGLLFHRYAWSPLHTERLATEAERTRLERANRQARAVTQPARVAELERQEGRLEVALAAYEALLPDRSEASALLSGVAGAALSADVDIVSFAPRDEIAGPVLVEIPYDVQVQGSYHDVGRFLAGVINLPQLVRPELVALIGVPVESPGRGEAAHQVLGTLVLSTYVRADQVQADPAGGERLPDATGGHAGGPPGGADEG